MAHLLDEDEDQLGRLRNLDEQMLTRKDLESLLEATLATICDNLRVGSSFVASLLAAHPELVARIGAQQHELDQPEDILSGLRETLLNDVEQSTASTEGTTTGTSHSTAHGRAANPALQSAYSVCRCVTQMRMRIFDRRAAGTRRAHKAHRPGTG